MSKAFRSPLLGYNHNVKYGGHIFHVQTEDSGPANPHLFTHLFFEGSILASKRGQYAPEMPEDDVRTMMQAQHKAILKELKQSMYDERITRFFSLRGQEFPTPEFFTPEQETPSPAPITQPPAVEAVPVAVDTTEEVLDLDALPTTPETRPITPEPIPVHFTRPSLPGPGSYTLRRPAREVVTQTQPQPQAKPRPVANPRTPAVRPITPVVQRQVVVGAGVPATVSTRKSATTPVRRRPVAGTPFVVKEGSHVDVATATASRKVEPPPRSLTPTPDVSRAPRTADPKRPPQEASPSTFVTDQSLDDVILAYLSHGEGKR